MVSALNSQVGGEHYKNFAIQPTEFIVKNNLNFIQGNIIKYVVRHKFKNGKQDLEKARHYIQLGLELDNGEPNYCYTSLRQFVSTNHLSILQATVLQDVVDKNYSLCHKHINNLIKKEYDHV